MKKILGALLLVIILVSTTTVAFAFEVLEKGAKGEEVVILQKRLNELGYDVGSADGSFGGKTYNAICDFQRDNELDATGIVDEELHTLLFSGTVKTKTEMTEYNNSPEGFRLDVQAAKKIGDKFASGKIEFPDKCTSEEYSDYYYFHATNYDIDNGELEVTCRITKARGIQNISPSLTIEYTIPLGSGLWYTDGPNTVVLATKKNSYTLPNSMWKWVGASILIDFKGHEDMFKEIADGSYFGIVASNMYPSTLTMGEFKKSSIGVKAIKAAWEIWKAAGCDKLAKMK